MYKYVEIRLYVQNIQVSILNIFPVNHKQLEKS